MQNSGEPGNADRIDADDQQNVELHPTLLLPVKSSCGDDRGTAQSWSGLI
ncbi:protein of unknown function [Methylococcus capsulatus]|uniref:Uncharacterized protein n=1 Tax=Methylococcus capsulatus TaxID=414 RepID=A0AA35XU75_METCP|nr:protein of unknown function [Methylococcus capsulatus]